MSGGCFEPGRSEKVPYLRKAANPNAGLPSQDINLFTVFIFFPNQPVRLLSDTSRAFVAVLATALHFIASSIIIL